MRWGIIALVLAALSATGLTTACSSSRSKTDKPAVVVAAAAPGANAIAADRLYGPVRQLTFQGPRAGEGYFSADGRRLIFQSERTPGNPFYQIYVMELSTGKTNRISNGAGKTTCAWIHPKKDKAMFASTHQDPDWRVKAKEESAVREKGQRAKYAWSYDDQFDLYEANLNGTGKIKPISPALGYDAEGSYSPDGEWIAFSSNRHAYSATLGGDESRRRDEDPSYFLDIYIMRADGTGLKRLTDVPGYDGGPFFSPDGKRLVWRRFTPDGKTAEVWTMNTDGTDQRQITGLGAMSWAPFFHPSGDYLIFTTNLLGYDNFELYMTDTAGTKKPVRVTDWAGFDGLPVFTPDGKSLAWTHRNEKGESQIYLASWNDELARRKLGLPVKPLDAGSVAPVAAGPGAGLPGPGPGVPELSEADARAWVAYLASAPMKGRRPGSPEEREYTGVIARHFERLGLKPLLKEGFAQEFSYTSGVREAGANTVSVHRTGQEPAVIKFNDEWAPLSFSASGEVPESEVVFAGFGIVAPAAENQPVYDAFQNLDVKDKWVMVLKDLPAGVSNERRYHLNLYARAQHKELMARQRQARGLILVGAADQKVQLRYEGGGGEAGIPVIEISAKVADAWLKAAGKSLKDWRAVLDAGQTAGGPVTGVRITASIRLEPEKSPAMNVIGWIRVPQAHGTLMIGAHGDHLGLGELGNSLAKGTERGQVHFGADDNASGVAAVMELAQYFASEIKAGRMRPKYDLAFAVWSAEEVGILGSTHFIKNYRGTPIVSYLNLDMVGRLRDHLNIQGIGSAGEWTKFIEPVAVRTGVPVSLQEDPYVPSDAMAFYLKGIPSLTFFTGAHSEYHSPRDRAETLNYPGLIQSAGVVAALAQDIGRLTYKKVEATRGPTLGRGFRLYLGTIPDYASEGIKGVRISGTTKASPAEKAGLLEGDVIVQLGGTKIENIQDYVYCLQSMKANEKTNVKVLRQGKVMDLEIVPALKGT
jgi:Tol biopolymer transport system component